MTSPSEVFAYIRHEGMHFEVEKDDTLWLRGVQKPIPDHIREGIKEHKVRFKKYALGRQARAYLEGRGVRSDGVELDRERAELVILYEDDKVGVGEYRDAIRAYIKKAIRVNELTDGGGRKRTSLHPL